MYTNLEMNTLDGEIWKPIKDFEGLYEVSNLGRIKSLINKRTDKRGWSYKFKPRILKQSFSTTGYLKVKLNHKDYKVHRLVALAFLDKVEGKDIINHKDCNKLNNKVDNLEWCNHKENAEHAYKMDCFSHIKHFDKEKAILLYKKGYSIKEISKIVDAKETSVYYICKKNNLHRTEFLRKSKYIPLCELKKLFDNGLSNKEISKKFNIPSGYIARRRNQYKKGEI